MVSSCPTPCKKRPPAYVEVRIYPLRGGLSTPSVKALISAELAGWRTLSGRINTESQGGPNASVGRIVVVGVAVVVDIRRIGGITAPGRS